jgi:hypothetical protein
MKEKISLILFLFGFVLCFSQNGRIDGKLILEVEDDYEFVAEKTKVILKIGDENKTVVVDKNLAFSFTNLKSDSISVSVEPSKIGIEIIIVGFLEENENTTIEIPYSITCKYNKSKNNKICPICKKDDQVIPISYGLTAWNNDIEHEEYVEYEEFKSNELIVRINKGDSNSNKNIGSKKNESYSGGCVTTGCDPNWYCKRNDYKF